MSEPISLARPKAEIGRDLRREQLIEIARQLLGERGLGEVAMDEIAASAGVARSTLYTYFPSREALIRACIIGMRDRFAEALSGTPSDAGSPQQRLEALFGALLVAVDWAPGFFSLVVASQGTGGAVGEAVSGELTVIGLEVIGLVESIVADVRNSATQEPLLGAQELVVLIGQQILGALMTRAVLDNAPSAEDSATSLAAFCLGGLNTPQREDADHAV
ncbi:MAG: TetR/AcrR family transcriptional regulator [Actinobacteria bacterium]|nr:TetR/AcrR family transcriptional regulator [Actinomycetota bacterium]